MLFASCGANGKVVAFETQKSFSAVMNVKKDGKEFRAELKCFPDRNLSLAFTYPEALNGFSLMTDNGKYTVNAYGIENCIESEDVPDDSLLEILTAGIRTAVFADSGIFTRNEASDGMKARIPINGYQADFCFDNEGLIRSVCVPSVDFYAEFSY